MRVSPQGDVYGAFIGGVDKIRTYLVVRPASVRLANSPGITQLQSNITPTRGPWCVLVCTSELVTPYGNSPQDAL